MLIETITNSQTINEFDNDNLYESDDDMSAYKTQPEANVSLPLMEFNDVDEPTVFGQIDEGTNDLPDPNVDEPCPVQSQNDETNIDNNIPLVFRDEDPIKLIQSPLPPPPPRAL